MDAGEDAGLVRPAPRYRALPISSATEHEQRQAKGFGEPYALAVRCDAEVEGAEAIAAERVGAALQDDGGGAEAGDGGFNDGFEEGDVGLVVDPILERDVEGEVFA